VFQAIEDKALELYVSLRIKLQDKIRELKEDDRGVISAEFIAVTAVAVLIAITIIYTTFKGALSSAITTIGEELNTWVENEFGAAGGGGGT
jgi:Flp pilus assembly pilin Flp